MRLQFEREDEVLTGIVVGADGVNSTVRRYICGNVRPVYSSEIGFRGVMPSEKSPDLPTPTSLHIWCGPGTHAVLYGMDRGELVNFLAVYEPDQLPEWTKSSSRTAGTRDEALRIFENYLWDDRILDLVRHIEGDTNFWVARRPASSASMESRASRDSRRCRSRTTSTSGTRRRPGDRRCVYDWFTSRQSWFDDYRSTFESFERQRRRRTSRVQAYSRLAGGSYKLVGDGATRRHTDWPSLP